jgi:hypothetical protein
MISPAHFPLLAFPLALALSAFAVPAAAATEPDLAPWDAARNYDFNRAAVRFQELQTTAPDDLRLAVSHAAALLARQPRTQGNIQAARAELQKILAAPASATDSRDHRALAAYLVARIEHDHLDAGTPESARAAYEALRREHPGHPLADHAAVHLGFLLTEGAHRVAKPAAAQVAELEELLGTVVLPGARRELHLLIGHVALRRLDDDALALPHYRAALEVGAGLAGRDADLTLSVATLASRTGDHALAAAHYRAFAEARPRDTRAHTALRLAAEATARLPGEAR